MGHFYFEFTTPVLLQLGYQAGEKQAGSMTANKDHSK